jgi:chemotaxis signal transduction protein
VVNAKGEPLIVVHGGMLVSGSPTRNHTTAVVLDRGVVRLGVLVDSVSRIEWGVEHVREQVDPPEDPPATPDFVRWVIKDGEMLGLVDPDALIDRAMGLLAARGSHKGEEQWRNAF